MKICYSFLFVFLLINTFVNAQRDIVLTKNKNQKELVLNQKKKVKICYSNDSNEQLKIKGKYSCWNDSTLRISGNEIKFSSVIWIKAYTKINRNIGLFATSSPLLSIPAAGIGEIIAPSYGMEGGLWVVIFTAPVSILSVPFLLKRYKRDCRKWSISHN